MKNDDEYIQNEILLTTITSAVKDYVADVKKAKMKLKLN